MSMEFDYQNNKIFVNGIEILNSTGIIAGNVPVTPYGTISASDLQSALEQLASQKFVEISTNPPTQNVGEGDFWYQTDTESLFVYREIAPGTREWVPIIVGNISEDSDTIDAGAF
jgi:hypothetical protein